MQSREAVALVRELTVTNFDKKFNSAFSLIAFTVNRHLIRHMRRLQTELGMDLQTTYVWGVLAHLNLSGVVHPLEANDTLLDSKGRLTVDLAAVSALSLAQVAGLPRETVRRKLEQLEALGKVERDERKRWKVSKSGIDEKTVEFTRQTVIELLRTAEMVNKLLDLHKAP